MFLSLIYFSILSSILIVLYFILKPLIVLLWLKIKHGNDVYILYFPILGEIYYMSQSIKKHKDAFQYRRIIIQQNPQIKVFATNFTLDKITLYFVDPQYSKELLQTQKNYRKIEQAMFGDLLFDKGILNSNYDLWKEQRKTAGHQFTFDNLKNRLQFIKETTKQVFTQHIKDKEDTHLGYVTSLITGSIVTETFFGEEFINIQIDGVPIYLEVMNCISTSIEIAYTHIWPQIRSIFLGFNSSKIPNILLIKEEKRLKKKLITVRQIIKDGIIRRIEKYEQNKLEGNLDFIQVFLDQIYKSNRELDFDELINQFITFTFGGTDTTSDLTTKICYFLAQYPDVQEQVRQNVKEVVNDFDTLNHGDLNKLSYVQALINETLRVLPPAGNLFSREPIVEQQLGPFRIPKSFSVNVPIQMIQSNPKYFNQPLEFDLSRWMDKTLTEQYSFLPFSAGPKNCVGQHLAQIETKVMIVYLLLNYRILPDPKRQLVIITKSLDQPEDDRLVHFQRI